MWARLKNFLETRLKLCLEDHKVHPASLVTELERQVCVEEGQGQATSDGREHIELQG
jgi:hypothetical protein